MRTITFEDHGQDFLTWQLDDKGIIVDCKPFQGSVWIGGFVSEQNKLQKGGFVRMLTKDDVPLEIKYPILSIKDTK